jgi:hypothetical protein
MESLLTGWLGKMLLLWAILTVLWLILLGYRSFLASREEDQLFISGKGEDIGAQDQRELAAKLDRLGKPILAMGITVGVLFVTIIGLWIWNGLQTNI